MKYSVFLALFTGWAFGGVPKQFQSTSATAGDKCLACYFARLYFCTGVISKVQDCYDTATDCFTPSTSVVLSNSSTMPSVPWVTSPFECGTSKRPNTTAPKISTRLDCNTNQTSKFEIPSGSFSTQVGRGEICAIYFLNELLNPIKYDYGASNATVLWAENVNEGDPLNNRTIWDSRYLQKMHQGAQALLSGSGSLLLIGSTEWNINAPASQYVFNVVFTGALRALVVYASTISLIALVL